MLCSFDKRKCFTFLIRKSHKDATGQPCATLSLTGRQRHELLDARGRHFTPPAMRRLRFALKGLGKSGAGGGVLGWCVVAFKDMLRILGLLVDVVRRICCCQIFAQTFVPTATRSSKRCPPLTTFLCFLFDLLFAFNYVVYFISGLASTIIFVYN